MNQAFFYKHFNIRLLQKHILKYGWRQNKIFKNVSIEYNNNIIQYIIICAHETCQ